MKKENIDFTAGCIPVQMLAFTIPLVLGEILQGLYNSVDLLIVGNYVGETAQAAVSECATFINLVVITFFNGLSSGVSVVIARALGERNSKKLSTTVETALSCSIIIGIVLSIAGVIFTPGIVAMCAPPQNVFAEAVKYLRVYLAGLIFLILYNIGAGILRAIGNSRYPFYILFFTSVINVVLDIILVTVVPLGIAGVGLATLIAQAVSALLVLRKVLRIDCNIHISIRGFGKEHGIISEIVNIGVPTGIQGALIGFSNMFIWRYVGYFRSSAVIAGIGIAQRLDRFAEIPPKTFGMALTTFIGQNEGAGDHKRSVAGSRWNLLLAMLFTAAVGVVLFIFSPQLAFFFNNSPEVIRVAVDMMHLIIPYFSVMVLRETILGTLRGYGDTKWPLIISVFGMIILRQTYLYLFMTYRPSLRVIYASYPFGWVITIIMLLIYYFIQKHRKGSSMQAVKG